MARQRRTLDEQIADLVTRDRNSRSSTLSVPALAPIGFDNLDEEVSQNLGDMSEAVDNAKRDLTDLNETLNETRREVVDLDDRLGEAGEDLYKFSKRIDEEILPAIDDAAASPITDARFKAGSITVWPFAAGTMPAGSVGSHEISDFSLVAKKFKDDRHRIY